jgi:hypothetical protein
MKARLLFIAAIPAALYAALAGISIWLERKSYQFSVDELASVANAAREAGGAKASAGDIMGRTVQLLTQRYGPDLIAQDTEWIFMRAGGWMGAFK